MAIHGAPSIPITKRVQILRDGRFYSSQAAADRGPQTPRRQMATFKAKLDLEGIRAWLTKKDSR